MKIKNRTSRYLFPAIQYGYGSEFQKFMAELYNGGVIINCYIGDMNYVKQKENPIFIKVRLTKNFTEVINYMKNHQVYYDNYPDKVDLAHIFVMKVEDTQAYNNFILSRYSHMYTLDFLENLRDYKGNYLNAYWTLAKSPLRQQHLMTKFGIDDPEFLVEYDSKIKLHQEVLNYNLTSQVSSDNIVKNEQ